MKLTAQSIKKDFPRASKSSNYFTAVQTLDFEMEPGKNESIWSSQPAIHSGMAV